MSEISKFHGSSSNNPLWVVYNDSFQALHIDSIICTTGMKNVSKNHMLRQKNLKEKINNDLIKEYSIVIEKNDDFSPLLIIHCLKD